jgi:hypothetical protein
MPSDSSTTGNLGGTVASEPPRLAPLDRVGLVLVAPREAVRQTVAGRGAADVAWLLVARVACGETPRLARALARLVEGEVGPALMGLLAAASAVLPDVLGILIGAILLAFFAGRQKPRNTIDRTLDVAAYAWVPYLVVELAGALVWTALGREMRPREEIGVDVLAVGWATAVWILGLIELRRRT